MISTITDDYAIRERSFLIVGTRAEDNFAQLEKISHPILNTEKVFRTPSPNSLCIKHRFMDRYEVVPGDFHMYWSNDSSFPDLS